MPKPTKMFDLQKKVHDIINKLPLDDQIGAYKAIAEMVMIELQNDAIQPRYGISESEAASTLAYLSIKSQNLVRAI